ncbi:MAG: glycosyltransferase [Planctomycetota bacterium]|jgi:glycosyltransferase involved in cell wall biosynthesis
MGRRIRIMHLITSLVPSGAERVLYELATRLDNKRFDVSVTCISAVRGEIGEWLAKAGIPVHYLDVKMKFSPLRFSSLAALLRKERPRILHTHLFHADQAGRIAARLAGVPFIVSTEHIVEKRKLPWRRVINSFTIGLADRIACVSESVKKYLEETHRVPEGKLTVIPNGIDLSRFDKPLSKSGARKKLGLPENTAIIASVGRLDFQKGFDILLEAFRQIEARRETLLVIGGDGPLHGKLEKSAGANARFLGRIDNVPQLLAAADIYVQPSRWEGHPIALIEAMASGLPIVATDVPGNRDTVRNGENGILAEPESPEILAEAIMSLLSDGVLAEKLGASARNLAKTEFSAKLMTERYCGLYVKLADKPPERNGLAAEDSASFV